MPADILDFDEKIRVAAATGLVERMVWARQMGQSFNGERDLYTILGYNRQLTLEDLRERYDRGGVAGRIVDALPNATWRGGVELIEDDTSEEFTEFETAWDTLNAKYRLVSKLLRGDILSRLSSFSGLLIGAAGDLATPLPKGKPDGLLFVQPYIGSYVSRVANNGRRGIVSVSMAQALSQRGSGDLTIKSFDEEPSSPRYGQPATYELRRTAFGPESQVREVHWSRVVHIAEGLDDDVYGPPALERPWNLLDDLVKVTGGGAEAFFQRANQGRNIKVDKDIAKMAEADKASIREDLELLALGYGKNVFTRGVDIEPFGSDVANFNGPADAILIQIAGTCGIPKRILTGSEMGELASSQDRENWKDQVNGRREQHAGPNILQRLADRLIEYGYLPTPKKEYEPKWGTILNRTEQEKLAGLTAWCQAKTDEGPAASRDEIRAEWMDKGPLDKEQLAKIEEAVAAKQERAQAAAVPRAAEEGISEEVVEVLKAAIEADAKEVIKAIIGVSLG